MSDFISEEEIFPEDIIEKEICTFFFFECKRCNTRWISTFCYCPYCMRVQKFRILDAHEYEEKAILDLIASKFHYVKLMGER